MASKQNPAQPAGTGAESLSKAEAVKELKGVVVTVPARNTDGTIKVDKDKRPVVIERAVTESDIIAINEHAHAYHVITVDGAKHAIEK
jgi:hypothetical protein